MAEVHNNEWCYCVWFSFLQICYHGICAYVRFALSHNWSEVTSTLIFSVVLMSTSTTAQDRGGTLMFLFSDIDALDGVWYSATSAMTSLFCVYRRVFVFVHEIPMQFWIEKSLPRIMGFFKCSHTMNIW